MTWVLSKSMGNQNKVLKDLSVFIQSMRKDGEGKKANDREGCYGRR